MERLWTVKFHGYAYEVWVWAASPVDAVVKAVVKEKRDRGADLYLMDGYARVNFCG